MKYLVAALMFVAAPALAAPPPVGSEDAKIMGPFKEWITNQHDSSGRWCCSISDMRPTDARIVGDHWEVHVTPQHWPGETDRWIAVPDEKVIRGKNPVGVPILGLYQGRVQCFITAEQM